MALNNATIAPIEGAIQNPDHPYHYMVVQKPNARVRVSRGDQLLADTTHALRVIEIAKSAYEPRYYIPRSDVLVDLHQIDKTTYCPLKGTAHYFTIGGDEIAWGYAPLDFADVLKDHVSFSGSDIVTTQGG